MQQIGDVLAGVRTRSGRRTHQPVHRDTKVQPGGEGRFWTAFDRRNRSRFLQAAEKYDRVHRMQHRRQANGKHNGPLGHVGLEVLRELLRTINFKTGQLDPAIATIAERVGRSIAAVVDALKRLKDHGWVDWIRRYVPTGNRGERGPQVVQTSNAYRLMLPKAASWATAPLPDDDVQRRAEVREADNKHLVDELYWRGQATAIGGPLGEALGSLARQILQRDSEEQHESPQS